MRIPLFSKAAGVDQWEMTLQRSKDGESRSISSMSETEEIEVSIDSNFVTIYAMMRLEDWE